MRIHLKTIGLWHTLRWSGTWIGHWSSMLSLVRQEPIGTFSASAVDVPYVNRGFDCDK